VYVGLMAIGGVWVAFQVRSVQARMPALADSESTAERQQPVMSSQPQSFVLVSEPPGCAYCAIREQNATLQRTISQLQELDQVRSDLVSMVSHDLRAPLTNISGSIELMQNGCSDPACMCQELLPIISDQTGRLTRLVQGLLNVTRIEAGRLHLHSKPALISAMARRAVRATQVGLTDHRFEIQVADDLPLVWVDEDRIEEVLVNLLDNAVKYSPDGGTIRVDARMVAGEVVVSVTDPGIGIPAEELERIFQKYQRGDGSDGIRGHGLGLYICQKLVEAHGGRIWAESNPGAGSTFRFSLPTRLPATQK
jgi:signal transduction histidine kinase